MFALVNALAPTERSCSGLLFIYRHRSYKLQFNRINKLKSSVAKDANRAVERTEVKRMSGD